MRFAWIVAIGAMLLRRVPTVAPQGATPTVVYTGRFITLDSTRPRAEAIAVRAGVIVALGSRREVDAAAGPTAGHEVLPGFVLPGLADAHAHARGLGDRLVELDFRSCSRAQIIAAVRAAAARAAPGAWIRGGGWDQAFWRPAVYPTAADLDSVSAGHPVVLDRIDGHAIWVNSRALDLARLTSAVPDPAGGRIIRDELGRPSGVLVDHAAGAVTDVIPTTPMAEQQRRLRAALEQYAAWGFTAVHDAGVGLAEIAAYHALASEGPLPVRIYAMASAADSVLAPVLARGPEIGTADGTFTLRSVKIVLDGALGSRGAELSAPYSDAPTESGLSLLSDARLDSIIARAAARGFQVNVHAIGDRANHRVLDAFERAGPVARRLRFRVEHASMVRDEDVSRFSALGVIASMQPVFVGEYSRFAEHRVGQARLPWVSRTRDLLEAGTVVAAGTDFPASDAGDAASTLFAMVTRRGADGTPVAGWLPGQRISVVAGLRAMTSSAAYAGFEEQNLGILTVGRRADFTVLSADPTRTAPSRLRQLKVLRTMVGGRTTYRGR